MSADLIVIRPAADLPEGFLPDHLNGLWMDLDRVTKMPFGAQPGDAVAIPTGRFEVRDDGVVAEVWEVRP